MRKARMSFPGPLMASTLRRLIAEIHNEDNQHILDELMAPDVFNHSAVPEHQSGFEPVV